MERVPPSPLQGRGAGKVQGGRWGPHPSPSDAKGGVGQLLAALENDGKMVLRATRLNSECQVRGRVLVSRGSRGERLNNICILTVRSGTGSDSSPWGRCTSRNH